MNSFFYFNIFFACVIMGAAAYAFYLIKINRRQRELSLLINKELSKILSYAKTAAEKTKKIMPKMEHQDLTDPAILSTLVTVLVHKLGDVRLNVTDFTKIPESEYVSVYVDTMTNDIVLSLDHDMGTADAGSTVAAFAGLVKTDDETYH